MPAQMSSIFSMNAASSITRILVVNERPPALPEGIERIFAQYAEILKQKGVSPIQAVGERFDPARHEALLSVPSDEEPHVILEEFETGYLRNGRVLRPSKVNVSTGKAHREETA